MSKVIQWATYAFYITILFTAGFWMGLKWQTKQPVSVIVNEKPSQPLEVLKVNEVFWIQAGQPPTCPATHPVKAKLGTDSPVFYTPDNARYEKIKPQLCFANEETASNVAGFIKKY
jgi:hypothetical protein